MITYEPLKPLPLYGGGVWGGGVLPAELRVVRDLINLDNAVNAKCLYRGDEIIPAGIDILPPEDEFSRHLRYEIGDAQAQFGHFRRLRSG